MNTKTISRQTIVVIFIFAIFAVVLNLGSARSTLAQPAQATTAAAPAAGAAASVADVKGKVQVTLPGQAASAPQIGQLLPAETIVATGKGGILLRLEDGSQIVVQSNTNIVLKQPSPTSWQRLQLMLGKIKAEIQKRTGGSPPFQIGTPSAVITVRGTRFYVQVDKHKITRVDVEEGVVDVESVKGIGKPVQIKGGHSSTVKEDSAPEEPKQSPGQDRESGNSGNGRDNGQAGSNSHASPPGGRGRRP